jgi:hypothetical protein
MMIAEAATAISAQVMALITQGTIEADRSMAQWAFCALSVAVLRFFVAQTMAFYLLLLPHLSGCAGPRTLGRGAP